MAVSSPELAFKPPDCLNNALHSGSVGSTDCAFHLASVASSVLSHVAGSEDRTSHEWTIVAGRQQQSHEAGSKSSSVTCFIGGVADGTSEQSLIDDAFRKGVRIRKCHVLPKTDGFPGCVAFKAFLHLEDVSRATSGHFWPRGIWCRRWKPRARAH